MVLNDILLLFGSVARQRVAIYLTVGFGLALSYGVLRELDWRGAAGLHTAMEAAAALLAMIVGVVALMRFYTLRTNPVLLIGVGFLGAGFLDLYHAIVTSAALKAAMPSELASLVPWSWFASRLFLAMFFLASAFVWWRKHRSGDERGLNERSVYVFATLATLLSFAFFAFAPLPRAYYPEIFLHRPEDAALALLFLAALIGHIRKGGWRYDVLKHWLVLSLIVALVGQAVFMPFSGKLFDMQFDFAHLLKIVSYGCVLVGLLASLYSVHRHVAKNRDAMVVARDRAEASLAELTSLKEALDEHAIVAVTDTSGTITHVNDKFCRISKYERHELIGANHRLLASGHHPKSYFTDMFKTIANGRPWHGEVKNKAKDGSLYWVDTTITPFKDAKGKVVQYIAIRADISSRKEGEEELKARRDQLQDRVTEATKALKAKTEALEEALAKEKQIGEQQRQFITMASHEFRTPLAIIDATAQRLKSRAGRDILTPEDAIVRVDKIRSAVARMTRLMESTLSLARAEEGEIKLNIETCDLGAILLDVCTHQQDLTQAHAIVCEIAELPQCVQADAGALEQVFTNLVSNAVKYAPDAPDITVKARCEGHEVVVTVQDGGIGIDTDELDRIGEKFFRGKNSVGIEGTGIGLSLVRHLIEKHDGTVVVQSQIGQGSTFTIRLPLQGPDPQRQDQSQPQKRVA
ncbi:diguanylate cyclase/phosphodiesterase (GGDEF & EAL domains) with PAS/PAC sensor(s) [hydrothermal vent metagenome]|uniref:histidine kinase n=1 Tax=hydrothermal vent metagenome TaxID=652676 RepID=A0A3B0TPH3_9ZZZZ